MSLANSSTEGASYDLTEDSASRECSDRTWRATRFVLDLRPRTLQNRPSVVVGDSRTGETQKYDGPYYVIRWMLRQRGVAFMPVVGNPRTHALNVVPSDFVVDAVRWLSERESSVGKVYHLADPEPPDILEMLKILSRCTGRRLVKVPLPLGFAKFSIERVPGVFRLMGIPASAVDYFVHPTRYDTTGARHDLRGSRIEVPRFQEYAGRLVDFVERHPEVGGSSHPGS